MKNRNGVTNGALAALAVLFVLPLACGGDKPPAATANAGGTAGFQQPPPGYPQQPPPGYPQQPPQQGFPQQQPPQQGFPQQPPPQGFPQQPPPGQPPPAGQPAPQGSAGPLGSVVTTDPNQLAQIFAQAAAAGQALLQQPGAVPGDPVEAGIKLSAARNAPGMQPEGQIAKGNLAEGGHLEFFVPMQAGKCYAVVGFATPGGVKNLDLHLLAPPFYTFLAGEDTTDDNVPTIGKGANPMCPIIPVAVNYKVDIHARKGAGAVGVQVYSKTK